MYSVGIIHSYDLFFYYDCRGRRESGRRPIRVLFNAISSAENRRLKSIVVKNDFNAVGGVNVISYGKRYGWSRRSSFGGRRESGNQYVKTVRIVATTDKRIVTLRRITRAESRFRTNVSQWMSFYNNGPTAPSRSINTIDNSSRYPGVSGERFFRWNPKKYLKRFVRKPPNIFGRAPPSLTAQWTQNAVFHTTYSLGSGDPVDIAVNIKSFSCFKFVVDS